MPPDNQVLIAIINSRRDFAIVREQRWYRIPVSSAKKWPKRCWPPSWIAFYLPKVFGAEAFAISYYAEVLDIRRVQRWQLFPNEPAHKRGNRLYYQLLLGDLYRLPQPILARRRRRIVFIQTTWQKFMSAVEINDLYDESPLEDRLRAELKRHHIPAVRQVHIEIGDRDCFLDFAIYCDLGDLDVETDGDTWHSVPERIAEDNTRDNLLTGSGWSVLRFNTQKIREEAVEYCVPSIIKTINTLGGVDEGKYLPRKINLKANHSYQPSLFDDATEEAPGST